MPIVLQSSLSSKHIISITFFPTIKEQHRIKARFLNKQYYGSSAASSHYGSLSRSLYRATASDLGHNMQATSFHHCNVYLHYDMRKEPIYLSINAAFLCLDLHLAFHDIGAIPLRQGVRLASLYPDITISSTCQSPHAATIHLGFLHPFGSTTNTSCSCNA